MNFYYCSKCHAITKRDTDKQRLKSFCDETGKGVILTKVNSADELAIKLRKAFLKNQFELGSFKPKEQIFLEMAFEQGVKVAFNGLR